jgi:type II secretory pathway pseudopilin PulG
MTTGRPHKLTLIQILALIALFGLVLTIVLPRWLDGAGNTETSIGAEE